jgi:hypothetical protein
MRETSIIQFRSVLTILGPGSTHGGRLTGPALFGALEILGYGFQDMVFGTWDLNFGAWEILGYDFQDMIFGTWDLNFRA